MGSALLFVLALASPQAPASPPKAAEHTLSGQVVDGLGEPVPVAEVWVTVRGGDQDALARTRTDAQGTFVLGHLAEQRGWIVHAQADGTTHETTFVSPTAPFASLQLQDAGTVRGRLADAAGKPVAGAQVVASFDLARGSRRAASAMTDDEGRFELARVPLGVIDVRACKAGTGFGAGRVHVTGPAELSLAVAKAADTVVEVAVAGMPEDSAALPHVRLLPYDQGSLQTLPEAMVGGPAGKDGTWRSPGLPDWEYVVSVSLDGFAIAPAQQRIKPGEPHRATFRATPVTNQPWSGTLLGADGKPMRGVRLALRASNSTLRAEATSGDDGRLTFACHLGAGDKCVVESLDAAWTLTQPKTDEQIGSREVRFLRMHEAKVDPGTPLQLRAIPAACVAGRIVTEDGRAVPFARVGLEHEMSNRMPRWMSFASATTDRDGRYEFKGLHPLADQVRVHVAGSRGAADGEPFSLAGAGIVTVPELKLQSPGAVEGIVLDANGKSVIGARVWLRTWDFATGQQKDGSVFEVVTDRKGRYRHVGVAPGGYWLHWTLEDRTPGVDKVDAFEIAPGERKTVELR